MFDDHYQALWVPRDSSDDEIKKAYYALARDCHPDLHPNDEAAKKKFQRIQRAFEVLGDPAKREKYNRDYDAKFRRIPVPPPPPPPRPDPQEVHSPAMPHSEVSPQQEARRGATPSGRDANRMWRRSGSRSSPSISVMWVVFGGIAGIFVGLITLAMFFPHVLWNEQASRDPISQQEHLRPDKRRTQSDRPRQKLDASRLEPNPKQPDDSAAGPKPPSKVPASPKPSSLAPQPTDDTNSNIPPATKAGPHASSPSALPTDKPDESRLRQPSTLIAPFDAAKAKANQQEWASYFGTEITAENSLGMQFVLIPPGEFSMGSPRTEKGRRTEESQQYAIISRTFYLGTHEVTQEQYERVMAMNPSKFNGARNPVEQVTWNDANEFFRRLSALPKEIAAGRQYRLPTEAEWEYACRAGSASAYSFGDDSSKLGEYGWFADNSKERTHPVGLKRENPWGLRDMHGNVWEWCRDWYQDTPRGRLDPEASTGLKRVGRGGGSWHDPADRCRTAMRGGNEPTKYRNDDLGFRVILVLPDASKALSGDPPKPE